MADAVACALITGASKGIGRAIALQLSLDHNLHILLNYASDTAAATETMMAIKEAGGSAELLPFRVHHKEEVQQALDTWQAEHPTDYIHVLINNAGITKDGLLMWMPESDWDEVIAVSLKGMFYLTQYVLRDMLLKRSGRIVNIASLSGVKGMPGQTNYSAAKGGMIAATKALAQEIAKRKVTVNAVAPGFIETDMIKGLDTRQFLPLIPMKRLGKTEEVAHLVSFLVSDKASYITGEVIHVNGGLYS
ncbi:MAG: 3-oxoacyl-ACP reductase FabG [Bacteroidota bacterium]